MAETFSLETIVFRKNLGARLAKCVELIGKKSDAAAAASVSVEQLNKWIAGSVKVPVEALRLISEVAHSDFSWLATGNGRPPHARPVQIRFSASPPLPGVITRAVSAAAKADGHIDGNGPLTLPDAISIADVEHPEFIRLPLYTDVHASAGAGVVPASEQANDVVAFGRRFLRDQGAVPEQCSIIWARGTSMEPTIPDGAILVVDHSQSTVEHGRIYVFNVSDRLLVKRARWRMDGKLDLVSDNVNEIHPVETFAADTVEQLRVVGRLVYFCRTP